ncbi:TPA: hypothetical protein QCH64_002737 [Enterobacter asburiae]|uniref:hypothetical protein n=1 Tax=Enterobacter asburiae TaxID=61645 RepID=UPI001A2CD16E|nr:hypothetical protein [Enterobacter asburiae]MCS0625306.1 hypothetical protein [Enterobacter asburiae]HAT7488644.1 hypothetical protein [Enterobacter asburiae]HAT7510204.1 hypothetical protein [Enterobacter asburiae]HDR2364440.1 hypothetical protein [Enterobacter asburiae]
MTKIEALKVAISRTKHGVTRINDVVRDVNTVWVDAGEPYPLPVGEYKRRAWLLADLERMLAQLVDEAHAEALEMNAETDRRHHCSVMASLQNTIMERDDLPELVEACHAEALEEDKRYTWLANRWCLFHSSSRQQQEEINAIAWEQARQTIEAEEEYNAQKKWKLEAIWKHTHRDYKGEHDGVRSILVCRNGTISVPLDSLTDKEIEQRSSMWQRNK